jgi:anti-anti-sigma factor
MVAPQPPFRVHAVPDTAADHLFEVEGELDLSTADVLAETLEKTRGRVILDLARCPFIDSTGLALLLRVAHRLDQDSGLLAVVVSDPEIRRLFEITGLDMTIAVHTSRDEALESLSASE